MTVAQVLQLSLLKGIYFSNQDDSFSLPALNLKGKVVDTTGAGDSFNGALASGLEKGMKINRIRRYDQVTKLRECL